MAVELKYFGFAGRASRIVLLLEDAKVDYKYHVTPFPIPAEEKEKLPLGQLPVLEETVEGNKVVLFQTLPILSHLGRVHGYAGKGEFEYTTADILTAVADEWFTAWAGVVFGGKNTPEGKAEYAPTFKKFASRFEKKLSESKTGFVVGSATPTFADFGLYDVVDKNIDLLGAEAFKEYPHIHKFYEVIKSRPHIAAFLASDRKLKNIPF